MSSLLDMMGTVDPTMVPTVQPAEYSRLTGWRHCGERANGRGGLEEFIVAGTLGSRRRFVVQIMARHVLGVVMSF